MSEVTATSSHSSVPLIALLCVGVVQWVSGGVCKGLAFDMGRQGNGGTGV